MDAWYEELQRVAKEVHCDEDMGRHTTFRTGGRAKYYISPSSEEMLVSLVKLHKKNHQPFFVMGNGSNLLVKDAGYKGTVIQAGSGMSDIRIDGICVAAGAGALLSAVAKHALKQSLTGMEFAAGIPGSIGGAVVMNAGAYGGEIKDIIKKARVMTEDGEVQELTVEELELGYRTSIIQKKHMVVLHAEFELARGNQEEILQKMEELKHARTSKQPLEFPSAGSTFKRPEGHFAGKLIMDAGLAGYSVGGACVSEKHCGFVINKGNATATDIVTLMEDVTRIVQEKFQVKLEPEVKILG